MIMNFKVKINKRAAENRQRKVMYCVVFNRGHNFCCISPFCTLMLHQIRRKRHLISSPPPPKKKKMAFFFWKGGGVIFFGIFSWIFGFGTQKKFWKDFGAKPMFWNNYWPIPATSGHFVIWGNSKNHGFSAFLGKFGNFFFQNTILD